MSPPPSNHTTAPASNRSLGRNVFFSWLDVQVPDRFHSLGFEPRRSASTADGDPSPASGDDARFLPLNSPFHLPPPPPSQNHCSYQFICGFREREAVHVPADPVSPPMRKGISEKVAQKIVNLETCPASGGLHLLLGYIGFACLCSCFYRSRLRAHYDLEEAPCVDCWFHFCCDVCALSRVQRA